MTTGAALRCNSAFCAATGGCSKSRRPQAFFAFRLADIPAEDIAFLMRRYFPGQIFRPQAVRKEPYYLQRKYSIDAHVTSPRTKTCETPNRNGGNENWLPKTD